MKSIKLNALENQELERREQEAVKGGGEDMGGCHCACIYSSAGGSDTFDNGAANRDLGVDSPGGGLYILPEAPVEGERPVK